MYKNTERYSNQLKTLDRSPYREFCQGFLAKFNRDTQAAKIIMSGKLDLAASTKEQVTSYTGSVVMDALGVIAPTGTLGKLVEDITSALFKSNRKKGYKAVAKINPLSTQMELLSLGLVNGLLLQYGDKLCSEKEAGERGEKAAERILRDIKHNKIKGGEDWSLQQWLKQLLTRILRYNYIAKQTGQRDITLRFTIDTTDNDYVTILMISSAQLLQLPMDIFVKSFKLETEQANMDQLLSLLEERVKELEKQNIQPSLTVNFKRGGEGVTAKGNYNFTFIKQKTVDIKITEGVSEKDVSHVERMMSYKAKLAKERKNASKENMRTVTYNIETFKPGTTIEGNITEKVVDEDDGTIEVVQRKAQTSALPIKTRENTKPADYASDGSKSPEYSSEDEDMIEYEKRVYPT